MDAAFWERVTEAFETAVHVEPFRLPAEIDRICGFDPRIRKEVESLLQAHARASGDFLEIPVPGLDAFQDFAGPDPWIGQQIGSYHLIQQLGSGGMGDVYLARRADDEFDLQVAVKLMHRGQDSAAVVRRFKNERQILASLDHPNIARLLDGGRTQQGQLYLVMEYVRGMPITRLCDEKKLKIPERLELIIQTCEGVQHAHRNAIIHRDLKPSNVLVVEVDGHFVPRIIDFGIARADKLPAAGQTMLTGYGQFIGTPAYMSPEQADPSAPSIDTRTDVYSLGVILFEVLTGRLPFASERRDDLPLDKWLRKLREFEPRTPSATFATDGMTAERTAAARGTSPKQLVRQLRGDLDWITLKALAPQRERRYGTAADLAADLRRYLNHEAVVARPASAIYQTRKFISHHRVGAIVAGMTLIIALVSTIAGLIAVQKEREAQYQTRQALESQSRLLTQTAAQRLKNADIAGAQRVILEVLTNPRFMQTRPAIALSTFQDVRATDTQLAILSGHRDSVNFADYSPDGSRIVTASLDKTARIWDARTGTLMMVLSACDDYVYHAAFSPDGTRVVTTCVDKTARVWDTRSGAQLLVLSGHADGLYDAGYSPDGTRVITTSWDGTAQIWDARTGEKLVRLIGHAGSVNYAAYSPDGTRITTASDDHTARVWDAHTGALLSPIMRHGGQVISAAYSPDGRRIVTASSDKTARVWDARTGAQLAVLQHGGFVYTAFYSSDGGRIVSASGDNLARVWDAHTYTLIGVLSGHGDAVYSAVFSPDGTHIVTGSNDGTARVWSARTRSELQTLTGYDAAINSATYSADGHQVLTAIDDGTARIYDLQRGVQVAALGTRGGSVYQAAYSPDRIHIVTATDNNTARIWDATTGLSVAILTGHGGSVHSAAFSPDGARIATASSDKTARIWDATSGAQLTILSGHGRYVYSAAYSPDSKRIVTASEDRTARVWDARTGQQLLLLTGHDGKVYSAAFSPDGARIVTASEDRSARIWDFEIRCATHHAFRS